MLIYNIDTILIQFFSVFIFYFFCCQKSSRRWTIKYPSIFDGSQLLLKALGMVVLPISKQATLRCRNGYFSFLYMESLLFNLFWFYSHFWHNWGKMREFQNFTFFYFASYFNAFFFFLAKWSSLNELLMVHKKFAIKFLKGAEILKYHIFGRHKSDI